MSIVNKPLTVEDGKLKLTTILPSGKEEEYEGLQALFNSDEHGARLQADYPEVFKNIGSTHPDDPRNSWAFKISRKIRNWILNNNKPIWENMSYKRLFPDAPKGWDPYNPFETLQKKASMYRDPRNFILEKLQAATDVGLAEKARLAAGIRAMNPEEAKPIAEAVHADMGINTGRVIADQLFGENNPATFNGMLGVTLLNSLIKNEIL